MLHDHSAKKENNKQTKNLFAKNTNPCTFFFTFYLQYIKSIIIDAEEVKYLYNRFEYLIKNPKEAPRMIMMRDVTKSKEIGHPQDESTTGTIDEKFIVKIQMWAQEKGLWENYGKNDKLISYIKAFVGDNVRAMHFMQINKPPDHGSLSSRHPMHQDQWYFPYGPSQFIVCSWTALQDVNRNNGCLSVVPGTHRNHPGGVLLEHGYPQTWHGPVNKAYHGIQINNKSNLENEEDSFKMNQLLRRRIHLEMKPGDTVFFHPLLFHASGSNLTHRSRRSISVHYASSTRCNWQDFSHSGQVELSGICLTVKLCVYLFLLWWFVCLFVVLMY